MWLMNNERKKFEYKKTCMCSFIVCLTILVPHLSNLQLLIIHLRDKTL